MLPDLTVVLLLGAASAQQVCVGDLLRVAAGAARQRHPHVVVLHVGVQCLQLAQLQEVRGKQSEGLWADSQQLRAFTGSWEPVCW